MGVRHETQIHTAATRPVNQKGGGVRLLIASGLALGAMALVFVGVTNMKSGQTIVVNGRTTDTSRVTSEDVEREVRNGLPIGSSLAAINDFLANRNIEHSYDASSKTVYAVVRKLKGGSVLVKKSLTMRFHLADALSLSSIEMKAAYTGP